MPSSFLDLNRTIERVSEAEAGSPEVIVDPSMEDQIVSLAKSLKDLQGGGVAVLSSRVHVLSTIKQLADDSLQSLNPETSSSGPSDTPPPPGDSTSSFDN